MVLTKIICFMNALEKEFLAWYFESGSDQEQYDVVSNIGRRIVEQLQENGSAYLSVGDLMKESLEVYLEEK